MKPNEIKFSKKTPISCAILTAKSQFQNFLVSQSKSEENGMVRVRVKKNITFLLY